VELFLPILSRRLLRHGEFNSTDDLAAKVIALIEHYNREASPSAGPMTAGPSRRREMPR
jgi:hypothetical protein